MSSEWQLLWIFLMISCLFCLILKDLPLLFHCLLGTGLLCATDICWLPVVLQPHQLAMPQFVCGQTNNKQKAAEKRVAPAPECVRERERDREMPTQGRRWGSQGRSWAPPPPARQKLGILGGRWWGCRPSRGPLKTQETGMSVSTWRLHTSS